MRLLNKTRKIASFCPAADVTYCIDAVERTLFEYGGLDILVNSTAAIESASYSQGAAGDGAESRLLDSLSSPLFRTQSALFYLAGGASIINTIPVLREESLPRVADYLAARLSLTNFTRALAKKFVPKQIRVNGVGLGSLADEQAVEQECQRARPGEIAPSYLFLASRDSSQMTGQVLYPSNN